MHGTDAVADAVRASIATTAYAVDQLRSIPDVEVLLEPELTVVLFRKAGWDRDRWRAWAADLLDRQVAFVAPTTWKGETVGRLVFLHPLTTTAIVDEVIDTPAAEAAFERVCRISSHARGRRGARARRGRAHR